MNHKVTKARSKDRPAPAALRAVSPRLSTGIPGLDDILEGGWPRGHLYLVEGDPGAGKTTLAMQFLLAGQAAGETTLCFTLSESKQELLMAAASHGWELNEDTIFEISPQADELLPEAQYTVFHPSEIELAQTTRRIVEEVEKARPTRVVIDSLSELRMLAREPLRYRRQILALKQLFSGRDCTVLLLDDRTADVRDLQLQSVSHGVLTLEAMSRPFGVQRRRLKVNKVRASRFREGYHDYTIVTGGLQVFPRLLSLEHAAVVPTETVSSGIPALDTLLGGGVEAGTSTLLTGPTGSGKSTIAAQYALYAARNGSRAHIYAFDENVGTLLARARSMGIDLNGDYQHSRLRIEQVSPAVLAPDEFVQRVRTAVERDGVRMIVIDSLNGLMNAMPGEQDLVLQIHELLSYLHHRGVVTILVLAQYGVISHTMQSPIDLSYLADTVILLRYFESAGRVREAISVFKKRTGGHERTLRELRLTSDGIEIGEPLVGFRGILTGTPEYAGTEPLLRSSDGTVAHR